MKNRRSICIFLLMIVAGLINAYCVLNFKIPITHHTGNATTLATGFSDSRRYLKVLMVFFLFFLGAIIGPIFTDSEKFKRGFFALSLISLISIFTSELSLYIFSFISGFQNSCLIKYEGATVRTTHISGYLTDSAVIIGRFIKNREEGNLKLAAFFLISIGFFILGGILYFYVKNFAKITVAIIYLILAAIWR